MAEMRGKMVEADFEKDELIFRMEGKYYAASGSYFIMPIDEFREQYERRQMLRPEDFLRKAIDKDG